MKKILIIDDDRAVCDFLKTVLSKRGFDVTVSLDARGGFETARSVIPDLIFINLLISGTNGLKVSKAIHSVRALEKVPVIMLISHEGELDPKYTATIGIVATLVKPLIEEDVIKKAASVLGDMPLYEIPEETIREIQIEEAVEPLMLHEELLPADELAEASVAEMEEPLPQEAGRSGQDTAISFNMTKEEDDEMPQKENPFEDKGEAFDEKDLFSEDRDLFSEELKKSQDEITDEQHDSDIPEYEPVPDIEEKPATSLRRILIIAASIVVGIGLGIGGYLFFAAGNKQAPAQKQIAKVAPEPVQVQAVPVPEKPAAVPEAAVKPEPITPESVKPEAKQQKDAKPQEPAVAETPKKDALPKAEPEKVKKEPAVTVKPEQKKPASEKPSAKKEAAAAKRVGAYYVQAGLFENEKNADAVAEKLKQSGFNPTIKKIENKDKKIIYRVVAGSYQNFKKAVEVSETLNKQGIKTIVHKQ